MSRLRLLVPLALLCSLLLSSCGGAAKSTLAPIPPRAPSAGDAMLTSIPAGADMILEIDLQRLRGNSVVGPLLGKLTPPDSLESGDLLQRADLAVICVYDIGDAARQLVLLHVKGGALPGARALGNGIFAVGDPKLLARAEALPKDSGEAAGRRASKSMAGDGAFLRLRALPMPEKAESAAVRLVARLDFDARVALAAQVAVSDVPVTIALWADVVDDLAMVANMSTEHARDAPRLERAMVGLRQRLSKGGFVRYLGLSAPVRASSVARSEEGVRVVFVLGPKRLLFVVERVLQQLSKDQEVSP